MVDGGAGLLDWLLGADRCLQCHAPAQRLGLCAPCLHALPWNGAACPRCGLPGHGHTCGRCLRRPPPWQEVRCAFVYAPPVVRWIQRLKYHRDLTQARRLGALLALAVHHSGAVLPEMLLPMPLHPRAQRRRGYNQAMELARPLGRRLRLPLQPTAARRLRDTGDQTRLSAAERRRNLRGAFLADPAVVAGRYVAVVDDVLTTGASGAALATALQRAGAARVAVWCVARTPPPRD